MKHLALPALLTAALLTPPAAYAGESAADDVSTIVKTDKRGDVEVVDGGRPSAGARSTTDVVEIRHEVNRTSEVLTTTFTVRDLTGAGRQYFAVLLEEEDGGDVAYAYGTRGRERVEASFDDRNASRCDGGRLVTRWAKNQVVLRLPFDCLGSHEAVGLLGYTVTSGRRAAVVDVTRRTRQQAFPPPAA